jgi:hypothetical protein
MKRKHLLAIAILTPFVIYVFFVFAGLRGTTVGLRAKVETEDADIGIPGISKMYRASLVNLAPWPILVSRCDYISDAMQHGTELAYAVQKWDNFQQQWSTSDLKREAGREADFCKPSPESIIEGRTTQNLLWPGQRLYTNSEATAANDEFHIGDRVRFVVFINRPGNYSSSVTTPLFVIDQSRQFSFPAKVAH